MAAHDVLLNFVDIKILNIFVGLTFMIIKDIFSINFSFFIIFPIEILDNFWQIKFSVWILTNFLLNLLKRGLKIIIFEAKYINCQLICDKNNQIVEAEDPRVLALVFRFILRNLIKNFQNLRVCWSNFNFLIVEICDSKLCVLLIY